MTSVGVVTWKSSTLYSPGTRFVCQYSAQSKVFRRRTIGSGGRAPDRVGATSPQRERIRCCGKCHPVLLNCTSSWMTAALYCRGVTALNGCPVTGFRVGVYESDVPSGPAKKGDGFIAGSSRLPLSSMHGSANGAPWTPPVRPLPLVRYWAGSRPGVNVGWNFCAWYAMAPFSTSVPSSGQKYGFALRSVLAKERRVSSDV